MSDLMTFPETVEEFMEQYKVVDSDRVYTNGTELVPIYRMKQWFEHIRLTDVPHWIPCSDRLPERIINGDVETVQEFFVTVKERWPGEEWSYHTDVAEFPGDYIDDIWQTYNDWREGQEVHVIAWMPLPEPYKDKR